MRKLQWIEALQLPLMSEKATAMADKNRQHVFVVDRDADKPLIKKAVEKQFKVEVQAVRLLNVKGKVKRIANRRRPGRRSHWKKAYVTLKPGHDIELAGIS